MTIFQENYSADTEYTEKKINNKAKLTSVCRLLLLSVAPGIKETYDNIHLLVELTNLNNISFQFFADFKVLLLVNGQKTASATFACPYSCITLKELHDSKEILDESIEEDDDESTELKTYGDLKKDYHKFESLGKDKKKAREGRSTVDPPLVQENDDSYVIRKCVIPKLHILQGYVNHLFISSVSYNIRRKQSFTFANKNWA